MGMTDEEKQLALLNHERLVALECAVRALIAEHPDRAAVRKQFDALYAQHQLSRARFAFPDERMRKLIAVLFGE